MGIAILILSLLIYSSLIWANECFQEYQDCQGEDCVEQFNSCLEDDQVQIIDQEENSATDIQKEM